jgi:predicted nuclease of predicted toxin-antitoxin system
MRLPTDQDIFGVTVRFLVGLSHDVAMGAQVGMSRASDSELLQAAHAENRILITRDRDYGGLVFAKSLPAGVIYLRMLPATVNAVHAELARVLNSYSEAELRQCFIVVEPGRHRLRRLPP